MYRLGQTSNERLAGVDGRLVEIVKLALKFGLIDITIIEGVRSKEKQNKLFSEGKSKVMWPNSRHNIRNGEDKAMAVDAAPYVNGRLSWDSRHCIYMAGVIMSAAAVLGYRLRWGGNWDQDGEPVTDQTFDDLVHFELR